MNKDIVRKQMDNKWRCKECGQAHDDKESREIRISALLDELGVIRSGEAKRFTDKGFDYAS